MRYEEFDSEVEIWASNKRVVVLVTAPALVLGPKVTAAYTILGSHSGHFFISLLRNTKLRIAIHLIIPKHCQPTLDGIYAVQL